MLRFIRHSTQKLRIWLTAAAIVLLLTSVLEAGHGHGVFVPADDTCAICQQFVSVDKILFGLLNPDEWTVRGNFATEQDYSVMRNEMSCCKAGGTG